MSRIRQHRGTVAYRAGGLARLGWVVLTTAAPGISGCYSPTAAPDVEDIATLVPSPTAASESPTAVPVSPSADTPPSTPGASPDPTGDPVGTPSPAVASETPVEVSQTPGPDETASPDPLSTPEGSPTHPSTETPLETPSETPMETPLVTPLVTASPGSTETPGTSATDPAGTEDPNPSTTPHNDPTSSPVVESPNATEGDLSPVPSLPEITETPAPSEDPGQTGTPPEEPTVTPDPGPEHEAVIRRTSHGVVHILADNLENLAYGQGYAFAEQHFCVLADQIIKVRSERSRHFGAGPADVHVESDLGYLALGVYAYAEAGWALLTEDARASIRGYVAGYNQYYREVGPVGLAPECAGASWVGTVSETDLLAYYLSAALLSSGSALIPAIVAAQPPPPPSTAAPGSVLPPVPDFRALDLGSNGWAIGADRSTHSTGMLVANPHFPWEGENKLFESHLTIPGVLDAYGASLMGVVGLSIGFNQDIAWTHTVSSAAHLSVYQLALVPNDPLRYRYDGQIRTMTSATYTVDVKQDDESYQQVSRTLYRSHYGPLIAMEGAGWSSTSAFTMRDANENNLRLIEHFLRSMLATSMEEFQRVHEEVHGLPWVYTMATDREGNAFFIDSSSVPNFSAEALQIWESDLQNNPLTQWAWSLGIALMDGSNSMNEWVEDPASPGAGLVPYDQNPMLLRRDYVLNANDSHWLSNLDAPLEGFSPMFGMERTPRSPRTRMNLAFLTEVSDQGASGSDGKFTLDELTGTILGNRARLAELLRTAVVDRCSGVSFYQFEGELVDITEACTLIESWSGVSDLESVGAIVWREFIGQFEYEQLIDAGDLFAVAFDPEDPLGTPHSLATRSTPGVDPILEAIAGATVFLDRAGIPLASRLGDVQYTLKGDQVIDLHGGQGREGAFNTLFYSTGTNSSTLPRMPRAEVVNDLTDLTTGGYLVNYGTSFVMALEFAPEGPQASALLTYSQSDVPSSPYYADQTLLYRDKSWRQVLFTEEDILADPALAVYSVWE